MRRAVRFRSPLPIRRNPIRHEHASKVMLRDIGGRLDKFLEAFELKENETVLDFGCGTGFNSLSQLVPIAEKFNWTIYAVDNSESMIEEAKKLNPHANVKYVHADILDEDFPLRNVKFDHIFSFHYLTWLSDDYKEVIKELYKLLAPGGSAFITTAYNEMLHKIYKNQVNHPEWGDTAEGHVAMLSDIVDNVIHPEEWKKTLEDMNIEVKEMSSSRGLKMTLPSLKMVADVWFNHNPFALHLPQKEREELRALYVKTIQETETKDYKPSEGSEDKEYILDYDRIDMILTK